MPVDHSWLPLPCPLYGSCKEKHLSRSDLGQNNLFHQDVTYYRITEASTVHLTVQIYLIFAKRVFYKELSYGNNFTTDEYFDFVKTFHLYNPGLTAKVINYETLHDVPEDLRQLIFDKIKPFIEAWKQEKPADRTHHDP